MNPDTEIEKAFRLRDDQKSALKKLGIKTVRNLLYHFPSRYGSVVKTNLISNLTSEGEATIFGTVISAQAKKTWKSRVAATRAKISDGSGTIDCIWFHQPYIAKMFPKGTLVKLQGKITQRNGRFSMANPHIERAANIPTGVGDSLFGEIGDEMRLMPVYPESRGISSNWFYHAVQKILTQDLLSQFLDPLPEEILKKYSLPTLQTALIWIHSPKKDSDALAARKRFSFEEIFAIQIERQVEKAFVASRPTYEISVPEKEVAKFINDFPFEPTGAQKKVFAEILDDMQKPSPMSRLLEGDVGSGKTAVASVVIYATILNHPKTDRAVPLQTAIMAPTEILARQHFENFIEYFSHTKLPIGLITSSGCLKFPSKVKAGAVTEVSRAQFLKWVKTGELPIVVGTHALIQKSVEFKHLALVVIDEQHRFGTAQRQKIARKDEHIPHLLSMTATPIPRTLALTMYGDLDLSILDELPVGRLKVKSSVVRTAERAEMYKKIREELFQGRQAFVICPRIDEPDETKAGALYARSVKAEAKRLGEKDLAGFSIGTLHGKMTPKEKEEVMREFSQGRLDILVSTSVVEVGVNVPNATLMIIEGAERFGLAQLHQLRGRISRSSHQAYCFAMSESESETSVARLRAFVETTNGFALSEKDLELRGVGELSGARQWGISDIAMEALRNIKMVEAARNEAREIVAQDPELEAVPLLRERVFGQKAVHFE